MLQILGWLGCVFLVVKAIEFATSQNFKDESGRVRDVAAIAAIFCLVSAAGFTYLFDAQGAQFGSAVNGTATAESSGGLADDDSIEMPAEPAMPDDPVAKPSRLGKARQHDADQEAKAAAEQAVRDACNEDPENARKFLKC